MSLPGSPYRRSKRIHERRASGIGERLDDNSNSNSVSSNSNSSRNSSGLRTPTKRLSSSSSPTERLPPPVTPNAVARRLLAATPSRSSRKHHRSSKSSSNNNNNQGLDTEQDPPNPFATPIRRRLALRQSSDSDSPKIGNEKKSSSTTTGSGAVGSPAANRSRPVRLAFFETAQRSVALLGGDGCGDSADEPTVTVAISYAKQVFRFEFESKLPPTLTAAGADSSSSSRLVVEQCVIPFAAIRVMERNRGGFRLVLDPTELHQQQQEKDKEKQEQQEKEQQRQGIQFFRWSEGEPKTGCPDFLFRPWSSVGCGAAACSVDFDFYTRSMVDVHWRLLRADAVLGPTVARSITGDYAIREILGHGAQAVVRRAVRRVDGAQFAVKIIDKRAVPGSLQQRVLAETEKLRSLPAHPNIVQVVEQYEDADRLFIVLELMAGGELFHALHRRKRFPERPHVREIMRQVLSALHHIHTLPVPIAHRDLKLENVMLLTEDHDGGDDDDDGPPPTVKLIDFGLSKLMMEGDRGQTVAGTPQYLAPEILSVRDGQHPEYTEACDLWSAGVMMYALLTGRLPFNNKRASGGNGDAVEPANEPMFDRIRQGLFRADVLDALHVSPVCQQLVHQLICTNPSARLTAQQALNHSFFA